MPWGSGAFVSSHTRQAIYVQQVRFDGLSLLNADRLLKG